MMIGKVIVTRYIWLIKKQEKGSSEKSIAEVVDQEG